MTQENNVEEIRQYHALRNTSYHKIQEYLYKNNEDLLRLSNMYGGYIPSYLLDSVYTSSKIKENCNILNGKNEKGFSFYCSKYRRWICNYLLAQLQSCKEINSHMKEHGVSFTDLQKSLTMMDLMESYEDALYLYHADILSSMMLTEPIQQLQPRMQSEKRVEQKYPWNKLQDSVMLFHFQ